MRVLLTYKTQQNVGWGIVLYLPCTVRVNRVPSKGHVGTCLRKAGKLWKIWMGHHHQVIRPIDYNRVGCFHLRTMRTSLRIVLNQSDQGKVEPRLEAPALFTHLSLRNTVKEVQVTETDSQTPKTGPRTITEPQQPISEPFVESTELVDSPAPRDTVEVSR